MMYLTVSGKLSPLTVILLYLTCSVVEGVAHGALRFYRNGSPTLTQAWSSGIVQIYFSETWGNICDYFNFGYTEAHVICHQFGYSGASSHTNTGHSSLYGSDSSSTHVLDVSCSSSSYLAITQCSFNAFISFNHCNDNTDVIVTCFSTRIWNNPSPGDIRLTGGTYSNEGLLEVYCNGEWGTVCDDSFLAVHARVACRQLGYNEYADYDHLSSLQGLSSQSIWFDALHSCSSSDRCLTSCQACPTREKHKCDHSEDVTLECDYYSSYSRVTTSTNTTCNFTNTDTGTASRGALRFYRNSYPTLTQAWSSGIVQIYYSGIWGNICDDLYFGSVEADVICHQFGYSGASSHTNTGHSSLYGSDSSRTHLDDVSCSSSSYLTLTQCFFSTYISSLCTDTTDVIVTCFSTRIWNNPSPGDIRLTGGTYSNEGLLEVYCNGEWGTVCDDTFSFTEARVACKQLGYNHNTDYDHLSSLQGLSSQSIWFDALYSCSSSDRCLTSCQVCPTKENHNCIHSEDVTLQCEYSSLNTQVTTSTNTNCNFSPTNDAYFDTGTISHGALRFYQNGLPTLTQAWSSGIVQIYYSGSWGNICDDYDFESVEADVICHQFGYSGASSYTNTGHSSLYGSDSSSTHLDDVSCSSSSYLAITQCLFSTDISSFCTDNTDVIVTCYITRIWNNPSPGDIRLTGGNYSNEGLLEVYCNGEWGTVCDDTFWDTEAHVACKQLGYNDYTDYDHLSSLQGLLSQSIWFDDLYSCSSSDRCLTSCQACPTRENHNCVHSEDVTLQCEYSSSYTRVTTLTNTSCSNSTATDHTDFDIGLSAGVIARIVIGSIVGLIICIIIFTSPFCICCCLGVGVGATGRSRPYTRVVTSSAAPATNTAVVTTTQETSIDQEAVNPHQASPPPADTPDPPQATNPGQVYLLQGYPPQGYPPQGYPPQGYPPQGYPVEGYNYKCL